MLSSHTTLTACCVERHRSSDRCIHPHSCPQRRINVVTHPDASPGISLSERSRASSIRFPATSSRSGPTLIRYSPFLRSRDGLKRTPQPPPITRTVPIIGIMARPHLRQRLCGVDARCNGQSPRRVRWSFSLFGRLHATPLDLLVRYRNPHRSFGLLRTWLHNIRGRVAKVVRIWSLYNSRVGSIVPHRTTGCKRYQSHRAIPWSVLPFLVRLNRQQV